MLKILNQLVSLVSRVTLKITSGLGKNLWQIFFKRFLVPVYKVFLFAKKQAIKTFFGSPAADQSPSFPRNFRQKYLVPSILLVIFILIIFNNFSTRSTYAEEFNKDSVLAKIFISDTAEEIVERPLFNSKNPSSETIIGQLCALETKKNNITTSATPTADNLALLSQSGEALIEPNTSPFAAPGTTASQGQSNSVQTYEVQSGDTLSTIAAKFGLSINTLLWENNLTLKSYLRPGDKLTILPINGLSYTVKRGDTVGSIARKFNISADKILSFNDLDANAAIKISQKLIIPDAKPLTGQTVVAQRSGSTKSVFAKPTTAANGKFIWPSTSRRLTQYYSWRHQAIDIGAKAGTPIYALDSGRVELAGWSSGYGYNIIVDHGNGVKTRYGHSRKLYVKVGDQVSAGEVLGEVGSTGYSTGPHIHLELKINGVKVNPLSYL